MLLIYYRDHPTSPDGATVSGDPGEMSGTESQQGEELGEIEEEITIQEVSC